jgi:hypothetical protein
VAECEVCGGMGALWQNARCVEGCLEVLLSRAPEWAGMSTPLHPLLPPPPQAPARHARCRLQVPVAMKLRQMRRRSSPVALAASPIILRRLFRVDGSPSTIGTSAATAATSTGPAGGTGHHESAICGVVWGEGGVVEQPSDALDHCGDSAATRRSPIHSLPPPPALGAPSAARGAKHRPVGQRDHAASHEMQRWIMILRASSQGRWRPAGCAGTERSAG